jgi:hypothetical protein
LTLDLLIVAEHLLGTSFDVSGEIFGVEMEFLLENVPHSYDGHIIDQFSSQFDRHSYEEVSQNWVF